MKANGSLEFLSVHVARHYDGKLPISNIKSTYIRSKLAGAYSDPDIITAYIPLKGRLAGSDSSCITLPMIGSQAFYKKTVLRSTCDHLMRPGTLQETVLTDARSTFF